jgi:hypothetical protein
MAFYTAPVGHKVVLLLDLPHESCALPEPGVVEILLERNGCERELIQCGHRFSQVIFMQPDALW